jgi:tetratricopeptide (TPR) repeat protein
VRTTTLVLILSCLFVGVAGPAVGAAKKATLVGTLLDGEGAPLPGVGVTVRGSGVEKTLTTDRKGRFKVNVPDAAAEYEIQFAREGYPTHTEPLKFAPGGGTQGKEWTMNATPLGAGTASMAALNAFNAGARAHNDGDLDLALVKFGEAVAEDPEFVKAHATIATIHGFRKDHEQAAVAAARTVALDPEDAGAWRILYNAQSKLGQDEASATLDRLAELDPSPAVAVLVYNEGVALRAAGDRERARARYELAIRCDPELVPAHAALAGLLLETKEYEAALAGSERALELDPRDARGASIRYNTLIAMERHDEAKAMLEELQRIAPDAVAAAYLERGTMLFDEGMTDLAIPALEQALAADPQLARAHYTLGLCYMNDNRNADARRHLETFLELAPDDPDAGPARQLVQILGRSD